METSDDSFPWTDASSDSSKNMAWQMRQHDSERGSDPNEEQELQRTLPETAHIEPQQGKKKRKKTVIDADVNDIHFSIDRSIKSEPNSDFDVPKSKKKSRHDDVNVSNSCSESLQRAEDYLNLRVKQEQGTFVEPTPVKSKKKKKYKAERKTIEDQEEILTSYTNEVDIKEPSLESTTLVDHEYSNESDINYRKKKKKKKLSVDYTGELAEHLEHSNIKDTENLSLNSDTSEPVHNLVDIITKGKEKLSLNHNVSEILKNSDGRKKKKKLSKDDDTSEILEDSDIIKSKKNKKLSTENNIYDMLEDSSITNKKKKKKKVSEKKVSKESFNHCSSDDDEFQNMNNVTSDIVSSTLLQNDTDNVQTLMNDRQSVGQISLIEGPLKGSCRISDRIQFEEDRADLEVKQYVPSNKLSTQLRQFISSNANLTPLQPHSSESVITEDDEVWILKGPHEISVEDFVNTNLSLDSKKKVKINGKSYDSIIDNSIGATPIILHNKKGIFVKNVAVSGVINLRKRIPKVHIPYESLVNNACSFIPLPDTKCRHPLFGINYRKATKVPKEIAKRLNTIHISTVPTDGDSKKKKKHKTKKQLKVESDTEVKPNIETLQSVKKKRKRKHGNETHTPAKRIKLEPGTSADVWESEQAIEKNLFTF